MKNKKTFLIAGAASGIGLALRKKLLAGGHQVIAVVRSQMQTVDEPNLEFVVHDFSTENPLPDIDASIDALVYCPGTINLKPFASLKEKDLLDDFRVNVLGAFNFVHKYHAQLRQSDDAAIVLFSSVAVQTGMPFHASVAVSKGGVEGLTKSLSAEFAPKIRVNCIAPSLTDTPLAKNLLNSDVKRQANAERHPLKRIGTADEIAALVLFLLNDAPWMTGQVIGINGGMGTVLK